MRHAGRMIDGLDLHYYTVVGSWAHKGSATEFTEREWFTALQKALHVEDLITRHAAVMDQYDARKRVALVVGEWGLWHDVEPGTNPGFLYQQNTLRDALVAAVSLDIFNRHADRVRMANIAQTINVLQAMILTEGDRMVLTPTYHVFELYTVHHDAVLLPMTLEGTEPRYELEGQSIPAVSGSASRDKEGRIHVTLTNLAPNRGRAVSGEITGAHVSRVSGRVLAAAAMNAHNSLGPPAAVQPAPFTRARVTPGPAYTRRRSTGSRPRRSRCGIRRAAPTTCSTCAPSMTGWRFARSYRPPGPGSRMKRPRSWFLLDQQCGTTTCAGTTKGSTPRRTSLRLRPASGPRRP